MIRWIVVAAALGLTAGSAEAQVSPFGGSIPFLVNPYPVYGQGQPMDPNAGASCAPTYAGRGGARYPCDENSQRGERR